MKLLLALLATTSIASASHSVDLGGFYTKHVEDGYNYEFSGAVVSYRFEFFKEVISSGKVLFSNNSGLNFIQSKGELTYEWPIKSIVFAPFFGNYSTSHIVYNNPPVTRIVTRAYIPLGFDVKYGYKNYLGKVRVSHLQNYMDSYHQTDGLNLAGKMFSLRNLFSVEGMIGYEVDDMFSAEASVTWDQDYKISFRTLTAEVKAIYKF